MLYSLLKILSRVTVFSYFKNLEITGKEHLSTKEPVIVVANHPSTFMDPIILAVIVRFKLFFLAAAEYMGKGFQKMFFQRFFHMIPVYRPTTKPGESHKNKSMFDYCHKHLGKGKSLLIFPEGVSITSDHLHPLKTGVARIAIGAEKEFNESLDLKILSIGLNYSNPHKFRSNLLINVSEPIRVKDTLDKNKEEPDQVKELMKEIRVKLEGSVLHIEEIENTTFIKQISELLRYFKSTRPDNEKDNFLILKRINEFLNDFIDNEEDKTLELKQEAEDFYSFMTRENLSLKAESLHPKINTFKTWFIAILGAPIFLIGTLINWIPYKLVGALNNKLKLNETFFGAVSLAAGMLIFTIWYLVIALVLGFSLIGFWAVFFPFMAYSVGIYALLYSNLIGTLRGVNTSMRALNSNEQIKKEYDDRLESLFQKLVYFQEKILAKNS